jgi:hypothetical protein
MKNLNPVALIFCLGIAFFVFGGEEKAFVKNTFQGIDPGVGATLVAMLCILMALLAAIFISMVLKVLQGEE